MDDNRLFRFFFCSALGVATLTGVLLYFLLFVART
jgi:hypothetical protein